MGSNLYDMFASRDPLRHGQTLIQFREQEANGKVGILWQDNAIYRINMAKMS